MAKHDMKKKLLVSFSGGETSAFMAQWLLKNKSDEYEMIFVFANTSKEREETLVFADQVDKKFGLNLVWIEGKFDEKKGIGYTITDFENAKRNGEVFEQMIKCYGLPNQAWPHCNRELKLYPITRFTKEIFGKEYYTAIGIRADEVDRVNSNWRKNRYYYPLVSDIYTTKPHVNVFWNEQEFRLKLKGYQGNCNKCWKKSTRKLMTIERDEMEIGIHDDWWHKMEQKYGDYVPDRNRTGMTGKLTFYRNNLSNFDIREMSKADFVKVTDDSINYNTQETLFGYDLDQTDGCVESCEIF